MQVQTFGRRYEDDRIRHQFFQRALDAVRQVPGVRGAAFTSQLPLSGDSDVYGAHFEDDAAGTGEPVYRYSVTPEYFQVLKIALQSGRVLNEQDRADTPRVVVISESLARRRFPNESPIGKRLQIGSNNGPAYTVVGVVDDVKQSGLALSDSDAVYTTTAQWHWADPSLSLVVRSNANVSELTSSIRKTIWSIDKDLPIMRVSLMSDLVTRSEGERHFTVILFELFGIISLALAAIGLYGVQSGDVEERTREIGVRSALGASPRSILILILKRGVALTTVGICIGIVAAAIATRTLRAFLFEITPLDVLTYAGVVALLLVSATAASYIPARRAAKVDPMVALRYE
jgi:putative ABC transport system permease protein